MDLTVLEGVFIMTVYFAVFAGLMGIGAIIVDYIFPHIRPIQRWLDSLPDWEDERHEASPYITAVDVVTRDKDSK